jgi:hypothetical protein
MIRVGTSLETSHTIIKFIIILQYYTTQLYTLRVYLSVISLIKLNTNLKILCVKYALEM